MSGLNQNSLGPPLNANSLFMANKWFGGPLPQEIKSDLKDKYLPPDNTHLFEAKTINAEIYKNLNANQKRMDSRIKSVESLISTSSVAMFRAIDMILDTNSVSDKEKALLSILSDIGKIQSFAVSETILLRKQLLRPALSYKYGSLASKIDYDSKELFGEDLGKVVKDLEESSKVMNQVSNRARPFLRGNPRMRGQSRYTQKTFPNQNQYQFSLTQPHMNYNQNMYRGRGRARGRGYQNKNYKFQNFHNKTQ